MRGGRSSLGRGSAWPGLRWALYRLAVTLGVVGVCLAWFSSPSVGLGVASVALGVTAATTLYHRRWLRLQVELFVRRQK